MHRQTHARIHTCTHAHAHIHTCTHAHAHMHKQTRTQAHTHAHMHKHMHIVTGVETAFFIRATERRPNQSLLAHCRLYRPSAAISPPKSLTNICTGTKTVPCRNTLHLVGMAYKMQTYATHEWHGKHNMAWHRTTHYTRLACKLRKHTTLDWHGIQNADTCHTRLAWHTQHGMA